MTGLNGLAVALGSPCDSCHRADTARIEVTGRTHALRCRSCHADRGELSEDGIKFLKDTTRIFGAPSEPVIISRAIRKIEMKRDDLFPSRYFKAADLNGKPIDVTIKSASVEALKNMQGANEDKLVLGFVGQKKCLVVNRTNFDAIADLHGEETDGWVGKRVQLYPDKARVGGKAVDAVRVRAPIGDALNDSIPL